MSHQVQGDKEIHRNITSTETTEMEHKANTQERLVPGQGQGQQVVKFFHCAWPKIVKDDFLNFTICFVQKPSTPPFFTKKIQPCRAFEQEQAKFEVEFDGEPLPAIKWYREDFLIQNSPDFQIHTFSTKSILIIRQVSEICKRKSLHLAIPGTKL